MRILKLPFDLLQRHALVMTSLIALSFVCATHHLEAARESSQVRGGADYEGSRGPVPKGLREKMLNVSWRPGCPVALAELSYLQMSHWGFDGQIHRGKMVVHKGLADEVLAIFKDLFEAHFPIEKMHLVSDYGGSDDASMRDNNTSAFNCRWVTGKKGIYSKHSYGRAIDINTFVNPYVGKGGVQPKSALAYVDRTKMHQGMIRKEDVCYRAFAIRGWFWGGEWRTVKDHQHFEKKRQGK
jgi:hypothetical protein